jgi:hypothetical protein
VSAGQREFPAAASVELLAGDVLFRAVSYVVRGHTVDETDPTCAAWPLSAEDLGAAVSQALKRSQEGLLQPGSLDEMRREWRRRAGFRSEKDYERGRRLVHVEQEAANRYVVIPTRNVRNDNGFEHLDERIVQASTNAELGEAVRMALEASHAD